MSTRSTARRLLLAAAIIAIFGVLDLRGETDREAVAPHDRFAAHWKYVSVTSAVVYWHLDDISQEASGSYVEYGETAEYGRRTVALELATTTRIRQAGTRWAHLHWLTGLRPGKTYHYRMVMTVDGERVVSRGFTLRTVTRGVHGGPEGAIDILRDVQGPPYVLNRPGATYVLTRDISAAATAIVIDAPDITLDLDGHTVTFGDDTPRPAFGVSVTNRANGKVTICNGHIRQGRRSGGFSSCVGTRYRAFPLEIYGISTDVHLSDAYPIRIFGKAKETRIHHNHFYSRVTEISSRHYPGNDLLRIDEPDNAEIHHNLLTEGCHRGITMMGDKAVGNDNVEVYENDIRHHQQYVNGHALAGISHGTVHHNHVTSTGRGMQIGRDVEIHDNWFSIQGHMTLSDLPQGSRPWKRRRVELHGFKFEGKDCVNVKLHDNFMQVIQHLPNETWDYVPATPLNIACYNANAMNEVYNNTIVALTRYERARHGSYGDSGQWASSIHFVGMARGPARPGRYSVFIHDNRFVSNHLFLSAAAGEPNMTIRIEGNNFEWAESPLQDHAVFRNIPSDMRRKILQANNLSSKPAP